MSSTVLVADIGGTNARFALTEPGPGRPQLRQARTLATADFTSLQQAARHYLDTVAAHPEQAVIALAGPVQGEHIQLTNQTWAFRRQALIDALGVSELRIINDFGATARAVLALEASERETLQGQADQDTAPISVIGPGTGFGMALVVRCPGGNWKVIETEGGHASFAPQCSEERQIQEWLVARHGRASVERVLSGSGLAKIHAVLAGHPPDPQATPDTTLTSPAAIVATAITGDDPLARRALARFCAILGSVAGDAILMHGARSLAIGGGMVPRFIPFLQTSAFRSRLRDKGRFHARLDAVHVQVITHPEPGLLGAALAMDTLQQRDHQPPAGD